jgi:hypothetical protein
VSFLTSALRDFTRVDRYASMRVHGTSAHVELVPPDNSDGQGPNRFWQVERQRIGTVIRTNYPAQFSVHFSIPTPLIAERAEAPRLIGSFFREPMKGSVFKGMSIRVTRVEIEVATPIRDDIFHVIDGMLFVMDGDSTIFSAAMPPTALIPGDSPYSDADTNGMRWDIGNKRVRKSLGISFSTFFAGWSEEPRELTLIGAKAIFAM